MDSLAVAPSSPTVPPEERPNVTDFSAWVADRRSRGSVSEGIYRELDELAERIIETAGNINAANQRLLTLIREFDERKAWLHFGATSCANWLSHQIGILPGPAREKVRAARALCELPLIDDAFARGMISYSKVRAITRVATPENEKILVETATGATGAQLEQVVSCYRQVVASGESGDGGKVGEEGGPERHLRHHRTPDGMVRIEIQVHPDEAEIILKALDLGRRIWRATRRNAPERGDDGVAPVEEDATDPSAETSLDPSAEEMSTGEVLASLPVPPSTSCEARSPEEMGSPDFSAESFEAQDLGPREPEGSLSKVDSLVFLSESFLSNEELRRNLRIRPGGERQTLFVHLSSESIQGITCGDTHDWRGELHDGSWLSEETLLRIACDAGVVPVVDGPDGLPLDIGRRSRSIPPALRRALDTRDRGCRFPGCTHRAFLAGHHVDHWAQGGETKLANVVSLCHPHHVLVHESGFAVETDDDGGFTFRRPDGAVIEEGCRLRVQEADGYEAIVAENRSRDLSIDEHTAKPWWGYGRLDMTMEMDALFRPPPPEKHWW